MDIFLVIVALVCIFIYFALLISLWRYIKKYHADKWQEMGGEQLVQNMEEHPFNKPLLMGFASRFAGGFVPFMFSSESFGDRQISRKKKLILFLLIATLIVFIAIFLRFS